MREICSPIVELRQYDMVPGRRDELIELFDRYFVEGQEGYGMRIIGQFRDRQRPERFVWMRGFEDMETRQRALEGFYWGSVWKAHSRAANAMMIDASDVLLLKPAREGVGFWLDVEERPGLEHVSGDGVGVEKGLVVVTIYTFDDTVHEGFVDWFEREVVCMVEGVGAKVLGYFVTEASKNTFEALPVREGEHVFMWVVKFENEAEYERYQAVKREDRGNGKWRGEEILELKPTGRSLLR